MAGLISSLIIVLVFAISLGKCDLVQKPAEETSSPETTNLDVTSLNEEQVTQFAETLGFLGKIISESIERGKKKSTKFGQKRARFGKKSAKVSLQRPQDKVEQFIQFAETLGFIGKTILQDVTVC